MCKICSWEDIPDINVMKRFWGEKKVVDRARLHKKKNPIICCSDLSDDGLQTNDKKMNLTGG